MRIEMQDEAWSSKNYLVSRPCKNGDLLLQKSHSRARSLLFSWLVDLYLVATRNAYQLLAI
jgi:hypothetical protein